MGISSLVPRPPPLRTGKAWEHSSCGWTQGGYRREGLIFKYVYTVKWSKWVVSIMLRSAVQWWITVIERVILCIVFTVGPLPPRLPRVHLADVIHVINAPRPLAFLPVFHSCVLLWTQMRDKNRGGLWTRLGNFQPSFEDLKMLMLLLPFLSMKPEQRCQRTPGMLREL